MSAEPMFYTYCEICFAPAGRDYRCKKHPRVNPDCPWCGMPVDQADYGQDIAKVRGVLWHAGCIEDHQMNEMKEAER